MLGLLPMARREARALPPFYHRGTLDVDIVLYCVRESSWP